MDEWMDGWMKLYKNGWVESIKNSCKYYSKSTQFVALATAQAKQAHRHHHQACRSEHFVEKLVLNL